MKTILVLAWDAEDLSAFEATAALARRFGSHVVGLGPPSYRAVSVAWTDVGMGAPFDTPLADDEEERKRMAGLQAAFQKAMDGAGIAAGDGSGAGPSAAWTELQNAVPMAIGSLGRVADMMVLPQPGPLPKMPESLFEGALFDSGRPVLLVPPGRQAAVGQKVVIAWNGSTETARALSMAMPLIKGAAAVEVISIEGAMVQGPSGAELATALRRHGLPVSARHCESGGKSTGQAMVDESLKFGADLIVKGAYTQSRLRQMIFGGLTRHLILSSPIPVMFAH
ncbi:MAG: universal stress protein [Alphaproteobacteria bacterium]|nr:universal stress protein [Alphaproteobacteria bacterium]